MVRTGLEMIRMKILENNNLTWEQQEDEEDEEDKLHCPSDVALEGSTRLERNIR